MQTVDPGGVSDSKNRLQYRYCTVKSVLRSGQVPQASSQAAACLFVQAQKAVYDAGGAGWVGQWAVVVAVRSALPEIAVRLEA